MAIDLPGVQQDWAADVTKYVSAMDLAIGKNRDFIASIAEVQAAIDSLHGQDIQITADVTGLAAAQAAIDALHGGDATVGADAAGAAAAAAAAEGLAQAAGNAADAGARLAAMGELEKEVADSLTGSLAAETEALGVSAKAMEDAARTAELLAAADSFLAGVEREESAAAALAADTAASGWARREAAATAAAAAELAAMRAEGAELSRETALQQASTDATLSHARAVALLASVEGGEAEEASRMAQADALAASGDWMAAEAARGWAAAEYESAAAETAAARAAEDHANATRLLASVAADETTAARDSAAASTEAAAAIKDTGTAAKNTGGWMGFLGRDIQLFGGTLGGLSIPFMSTVTGAHVLADAVIELAAVVIPASLALGAFGVGAGPTIMAIAGQMKNMYTVTEATGKSMYPLTGGLNKLAAAVQPQVYQIFGDALNILNSKTGEFSRLATGAGSVLDQLAGRFTAAVTTGHGFSSFLSNAVPDLSKLGDMIGNLGGVLGNLLKTMPGYAQILLNVADGVTKVAEAVTGSPITQGFVKAGLAVHGFAVYAGLAGLAASKLVSGGLSMLATGSLNVATKLEGLGTGGAAASDALVSFGGAAETAAALPWGWIAAAAAAVGFLAYKFITAKDAADNFISGMNAGLASAPINQALPLLNADLSTTQNRLAGAAANMTRFSGFSLGLGRALAPIAPGLNDIQKASNSVNNFVSHLIGAIPGVNKLSNSFFGLGGATSNASNNAALAVHDYQAYKSEIQTLDQQSITFHSRLGILAVAFHGTAAAMGILTAAGVTNKQMMDKSASTWVQIITQVNGMVSAYRAMGQAGGTLGSDMNALTIAGSDQVSAMSKLNQAWDTVIGITSGGQNAFITFEQAMTSTAAGSAKLGSSVGSLATAMKNAHASMTGLNAPSLALRSAWQSAYGAGGKVIDALRMMSAVSTPAGKNISQAMKDVIAQLMPLGKQSLATRDQLIQLAQEISPNVTNFRQLTTWLGNTHNAARNLNTIVAKSGTTLNDLGAAATKLSGALQSDVTKQMSQATLVANGTSSAITKLATAVQNTGATSARSHADMVKLYNDLLKDHYGAQQAAAMIDAMTGTLFKVPGAMHSAGQAAVGMAGQMHTASIAAQALRQYLLSIPPDVHSVVTTTYASVYTTSGAAANANVLLHPKGAHGGMVTSAGIIPGFAGGAVLPGFMPGHDFLHALLSPGEAVLNPYATRELGAPYINWLNTSAERGGGGGGGGHGGMPSAGGGGGVVELHSHLYLDGEKLAVVTRRHDLIYNTRNSGSRTGLGIPGQAVGSGIG